MQEVIAVALDTCFSHQQPLIVDSQPEATPLRWKTCPVSVARRTAIWSHRCDAATNNGPGDEIVGAIVSAIATRLELSELPATIKRSPIERDDALQHYYSGLNHLYRRNQAGVNRALEQFQMAVRKSTAPLHQPTEWRLTATCSGSQKGWIADCASACNFDPVLGVIGAQF